MRYTKLIAGFGRRSLLFFVALVSILLLSSGCATQEPRVRTFVVEDGTQYFVRPMQFRGESGTALIDMTVRVTDGEQSTSVNFSLPVDIAMTGRPNRVESATFVDSAGEEYPLEELRLLYVEEAVLRYESSMKYTDLERLVAAVNDREELITFRARRGDSVDEYDARTAFYESMKRLAISLE